MTLSQRNINGTIFYSDGTNYYHFHTVNNPTTALMEFACSELGIAVKQQFTQDESTRINQLTGGVSGKTVFQLLKNAQAVAMPYKVTAPDIKMGDVLLRQVPAPAVGTVKCPHCASNSLPGTNCSVCGKPLH